MKATPPVPQIMKAITISTPGGPEVLVPANMPLPALKTGEVLIRVEAAGVNRPDIMQRKGHYPVPPGASPLPGLEVAGTIAQSQNDTFKLGDAVIALTNGGGYAEFVAVPEGQVLPLPASYSMIEGAALPETFFTVQQTLVDQARLGAGQFALIHGGSGGIGGAAIQLARLAGARAIATISSDEKAAYAKSLGAFATIDYRHEDFVARTRELTGDHGADVILDIVGGDYLDRNMDAAAEGGTIIQLAMQKGARAEINLGKLLTRHITLFGSTLRPRSNVAKAAIAQNLKADVWPALEDGRLIKPRVTPFTLANAANAHRAMEAPDHWGKIVLTTDFCQNSD